MRIHFTISGPSPDGYVTTARDIALQALAECKAMGTIAPHVGFKTLTTHRGGPGFETALEIQFETYTRDRGRRTGNSGSYGAMNEGIYTATYDEWGFFLAALYQIDEGMRCTPNFKRDTAIYYDAADFHGKTGCTYDATYPAYVEEYGDDFEYRQGRNQIGRRGAGRVHYGSTAVRYAKEDPRTAEFLRELHAGKTF